MSVLKKQSDHATPCPDGVYRIGCVSYLNAKPLIEGLDEAPCAQVRFDVPSRLLDDLETGEVDVALCPVIDYHRATVPMTFVPVGGIGCRGRTLTVRLFSRVPIPQITHVYADTDSHTSVVLMQVLLNKLHNLRPQVIDYHAREQVAEHRPVDRPEAVLLIGDKVVTDSPKAVEYPYQLDLGEGWLELTNLPFVFAMWMTRQGSELGDLPRTLIQARQANAHRIDAIVQRRASLHGWPPALAHEYLSQIMRYTIGDDELAAVRAFGALAAELGLIPAARPLDVYPSP